MNSCFLFAFMIFQFNPMTDTSRIEGIVIVDSNLKELQQFRLNLLMERKEELWRDGNWSEQDLMDFATLLDPKSFDQLKQYIKKRLKRIKIELIIAKEDKLSEYLEKAEFSHYLKFTYDLEVNNGSIIMLIQYDLFDHTGKLIEIDDNKNFFRQVKKINK